MSIESNPNKKETTTNVKENEGEQNAMNRIIPLDRVDCDEAFDDKKPQEEQHVPILIERPFSLTAEESLLFSALLAAADYHNSKQTATSSSDSGSSTNPSNSSNRHHNSSQEVEGLASSSSSAAFLNIRVAGGWVRDKLLRLSSDDIDITLDTVSGVQFAHIVRDYLEQYEDHDHHPHKYTIGVIAANPHQSKHLETATMKLFGYHVDFCHLRAEETYHPHSRIPVIREAFGTPYEDAMRRDFTINSLFYNIRSHTVEDYTRRGIHDLLTHPTIVTPLEAQETFHDDPLRVLRAIRFAVRFQYPIHETMRQAATSREVHDSLMRKVSRERVGTELEGMLTGKAAKPKMALTMIGELGLSDAVFRISTPGGNDDGGSRSGSEHGSCTTTNQPNMMPSTTTTICGSIVYHSHKTVITNDTIPTRSSSFTITGPSLQPPLAYQHQTTNEERESLRNHGWTESLHLLNIVDHLVTPYKEKWIRTYCGEGNSTTNVTSLDERIFLLSLYLSPFRDLTWQDPVKLKRNRVVTISMLKDGVKFPNRDVDAVECIMEHLDAFLKQIRRVTSAMMTPTTSTTEDSKESSTFSRLLVGMLLRNVKHRWVTCLLVAGCIELRLTTSFHNTEQCEEVNVTTRGNHVVQACENFYRYVQEQHLDCCWEARPLVNGKDIMQRLNLTGGGRIIGQLVEEQWKWMLQNPLGKREDCVAFLQQKYLEIIHS
jgi:tRNA nucleotidyltransferase/poly(A) polymerase